MNEIVTVYKINCYASLDPARVGENCSLLPWDGSDPGSRGGDDGGRDYVLPEHYARGTGADGLPAVFGEGGNPCELMLHNGCPLLIDSEKRRAHLLEPVKKMASFRAAAGLTRAELAERLGATQKEVCEWENLEREPDEATLGRIAEILGCSPSDFR